MTLFFFIRDVGHSLFKPDKGNIIYDFMMCTHHYHNYYFQGNFGWKWEHLRI